jgi:hypothetical protein
MTLSLLGTAIRTRMGAGSSRWSENRYLRLTCGAGFFRDLR